MSNQNLGSVGEYEAASWKRYFLARKLDLAVLPENLQRSHKSVPQDKEPAVDICHPNPHPLYQQNKTCSSTYPHPPPAQSLTCRNQTQLSVHRAGAKEQVGEQEWNWPCALLYNRLVDCTSPTWNRKEVLTWMCNWIRLEIYEVCFWFLFVCFTNSIAYYISKVGTDVFIDHFWIVILSMTKTYRAPNVCHHCCKCVIFNTTLGIIYTINFPALQMRKQRQVKVKYHAQSHSAK